SSHRRASALAIANIHSGTAANSLAKTATAASDAARKRRPCSSRIESTGPIKYIKASEVYGSNSVYSDPKPNAATHDARCPDFSDRPARTAKRPTATEVAAFMTTA